MSTEGAPSIHATAVAIGRRALLIIGKSGSGKSSLAHALMAMSTSRGPVKLIGDDRVFVDRGDGRIVVRGHPRIAGFIERRGLGIVAAQYVERADLAGIVDLGGAPSLPVDVAAQNFPVLSIVSGTALQARRDRVLDWWRRVESEAWAQHRGTKALSQALKAQKH